MYQLTEAHFAYQKPNERAGEKAQRWNGRMWSRVAEVGARHQSELLKQLDCAAAHLVICILKAFVAQRLNLKIKHNIPMLPAIHIHINILYMYIYIHCVFLPQLLLLLNMRIKSLAKVRRRRVCGYSV